MGFIQYISSIFLIGLFAIAIISFAINFGDDNDAIVNIEDDEGITNARAGIRGNVTVYVGDDIDNSSKTFEDSTVAAGSDIFESGGTWKVLTKKLPTTMSNLFTLVSTKIFGENAGSFGILLTTFSAFLVILTVAYAWKAWRGNPD